MSDNRSTLCEGTRLFSFAVISDTHLNEDEAECNSPFAVNQLANQRLRYVINDLNQRDLTHVVHLGDVVHPVPSMGHLYADSAEQFHQQAKHLKHPLHMIPGNHDVGDKPIAWGPSGTVRDDFLAAWTKHFGEHYFCFEQGGIAFIGINAQLLGSGLAMESDQKLWLEKTLEEIKDRRIYLCTHYPPFLLDSDEAEHYDNLGISSRKWLLDLLLEYQVEALFAGHVHHFWYNRYQDCQCYLLPSTAFSRQDYSEMFRVGPAAEFGRNDEAKLGYLIIHVHEQGHCFEMVRCYGQGQDESAGAAANNDERLPATTSSPVAINPQNNRYPVLGFDLRHDWAESVQIPPSGGLDEFDRKSVRNDYALLALWEMGVKKLRIPLSDLMSVDRRQRLADLNALGFEFTLYSFGMPKHADNDFLQALTALVSSWEICWPVAEIEDLQEALKPLVTELGEAIPLVFSPLRSKADIINSGRQYYHVINHGFMLQDTELAQQLQQLRESAPYFSGFVLRCGLEDSVSQTIRLGAEMKEATGFAPTVHLRLAGDNPAEFMQNEQQVCDRLKDAMLTAKEAGVESVFCDTLTDNDRGYFPRVGVLDRLYNPKAGFYLIRDLHTSFNL